MKMVAYLKNRTITNTQENVTVRSEVYINEPRGYETDTNKVCR